MAQKRGGMDPEEWERFVRKHVQALEADYADAKRQAALESRLFLLTLQKFMLAVHDRELANAGLFCSYCYGPISHKALAENRSQETRCPYCFADRNDYPLVDAIPDEVLRIYSNREARARRMTNLLSVAGLVIGVIIGGLLFLNLQGWTRFLACLTPVITTIFITAVGASIGARRVVREHDREWLEFISRRGEKSGIFKG